MSLINKVDITKFSDEELQAISAETKLRIHLQAKNSNLRDHLWALVYAVGRLLDDKYSEGDEKVRNQLWTDMHRTGDKAREYLQNSETAEPGEIERLKAENEKMRQALEQASLVMKQYADLYNAHDERAALEQVTSALKTTTHG